MRLVEEDVLQQDNTEIKRRYAEPFAFLGNSLLRAPSQVEPLALSPSFWDYFDDFPELGIRGAVSDCRQCVESLHNAEVSEKEVAQRISAEFSKLFLGPPSPTAPPWETFYQGDDAHVGYGEPTFDMRHLLTRYGLVLDGPMRQYEDHMGVELLLLSELCLRNEVSNPEVLEYMDTHPYAWIDDLIGRIESHCSEGFYICLLRLSKGMMDSLKCDISSSAIS